MNQILGRVTLGWTNIQRLGYIVSNQLHSVRHLVRKKRNFSAHPTLTTMKSYLPRTYPTFMVFRRGQTLLDRHSLCYWCRPCEFFSWRHCVDVSP